MNQYDLPQAEESAAERKAMFAAHNNARKLEPLPRCPLCSRTGHIAQSCKEDVDSKRDQKTGRQRSSFNNNCGGDGGSSGGRNGGGSTFKHYQGRKYNRQWEQLRSPRGATSVKVRANLIFARAVWTLRLRQPLMVQCTAGTSASLDVSREISPRSSWSFPNNLGEKYGRLLRNLLRRLWLVNRYRVVPSQDHQQRQRETSLPTQVPMIIQSV